MTLLPVMLTFLSVYAGMVCLSLTVARHRRQVGVAMPRLLSIHPAVMALASCALLLIALWSCLDVWGTGNGLVMWFAVIIIMSLLVILLLSYHPPSVPATGAASTSVALMLLLSIQF